MTLVSTIKDPLGCLEEIHSIYDSIIQFFAWMAHVGILIIEGSFLLLKINNTLLEHGLNSSGW
jgi:pantothenate kinase